MSAHATTRRRSAGRTLALALAAAVVGPSAFAQEALPAGPYQLSGITFAMVGAAFDEAAVRAVLPSNLEPVDGFTGGFNFYLAPKGFALAPFTAGYLWVDVKDHDGTGGPARWFVAAFYSDRAYEWVHPTMPIVQEGGATQTEAGGTLTATVGPAGRPAITIALKPDLAACGPAGGINHYFGGADDAGLASFMITVPWSMNFCAAAPVSVEIADPALAAFRPKQLLWAGWATDGAITLGLGVPVAAN